MLRVTPIYGSWGHHPSSKSISLPPTSTLIEYGDVRVLVNVGWDETYAAPPSSKPSSEAWPPPSLPDVDVILITDSTLGALGGLPLYVGPSLSSSSSRNNVTHKTSKSTTVRPPPPIYGTYPTVKMGQMTLYDHHANLSLDGGNPHFTLDDVDFIFSSASSTASTQKQQHLQHQQEQHSLFHTLKYSQTLVVNNPKTNTPALGITPHRSGRVVGGAFYVLKRLRDETEVVVAPSYHHAREKHLDSASLMKFGAAADVLITTPGGPGGMLSTLYSTTRGRDKGNFDGGKNIGAKKGNKKKKDQDQSQQQQQPQQQQQQQQQKAILPSPLVNKCEMEYVELIMAALRRDGNVLCPVDASGRVLELLLVLDQHWERQRLSGAYNLCWVGPMTWNTIEFARSQLEWMAEPLGQQFDCGRGHPYALKSVNICSSIAELDAIIEGSNGNPTVVLASGASLDCGPARDLLLKWAENPDNAIVLTDSSRCVPRGNAITMGKDASSASVIDVATTGGGGGGGGGGGVSPAAAAAAAASGGPATAADEETEDETNAVGAALRAADVSTFSASAQLLMKWCEAKASGREMADMVEIDILVPHRAPLAGAELQAFLAEEEASRRAQKAEEERRAMLREVELAKGRLRLGEEDVTGGSEGPGKVGEVLSASGSGTGEVVTSSGKGMNGGNEGKPPPKKKSRFDSNLFLKFSKPVHMTFEVREEAVGIGQPDSVAKYGIGESIGRSGEVLEDDYGIAVVPERFVDIVTGVDPSKFAGGTGRIGEEVLRRGLGFGMDGRPVLASSGGLPIALRAGGTEGEGANQEEGIAEGAESDEQALEAADLSEGKGIIRGRNGRPPIKVFTVPRRLEVLAEVSYVPLEGRVDARAARQSVRALQPRQVVILGGGKPPRTMLKQDEILDEDNEDRNEIVGEAGLLADAVRSLTIGGDMGSVFAPADGDAVELSVGHAAYSVRLIDTPYMTKEEKEAAAASGEDQSASAPMEPYEAKMGECTVSLLDCVATGQRVAADGSIVLAPRIPSEHERHSNIMLSDGDVLLTDLRSEITAQGMKAEYSAHSGYSQLVVNGKIIVKKDQATGKITVEGPLCQDFFSVRSVVCAQYVTL